MRAARSADPASLDTILATVGREIGAADLVLYLVDFEQVMLEPLGDHPDLPKAPRAQAVATTMAGRSFLDQRPVTAERPDGTRIWVPVIEGSDRTGVLALTIPSADPATVEACEEIGLFAGYLIATRAAFTDVFAHHRRRKTMSLAASIQWDLLPPLVLKASRVTVAGLLEPAYHVGGDCFDYAVNGSILDIGIFDAMGHGLDSALLSTLALGCYRNDRREHRSIEYIHSDLDTVIDDRYRGRGFVTGQLAQLHLDTGRLEWTNAGHPRPLLIRGGRAVGQLACRPTVPWGLTISSAPTTATDALEPGDGVLFFTDGVIDARGPRTTEFGIERLADLAGRTASEEGSAEETVRHLIRAILEHHGNGLADDATVVLVQWHGPPTA